MKPRKQSSLISPKLIISSLFFLFVLYVILRSNYAFRPIKRPSFLSICNKIPLSLSKSLIHYALTNSTPQQTFQEISVTWRVLENKSPCNFLVFGVGLDSNMWASLNHGGRTVFLEDNKYWVMNMRLEQPSLEIYSVSYDTKVGQALELLNVSKSEPCQNVVDPRFSDCPLAMKNLPRQVYETEWDLIMVDAPMAYDKNSPGRMKAIYTAGLLARNRKDGDTDIFVHDIDRVVENKFSRAFLCEGYQKEEVEKLMHFTIPSHRNGDMPFCP